MPGWTRDSTPTPPRRLAAGRGRLPRCTSPSSTDLVRGHGHRRAGDAPAAVRAQHSCRRPPARGQPRPRPRLRRAPLPRGRRRRRRLRTAATAAQRDLGGRAKFRYVPSPCYPPPHPLVITPPRRLGSFRRRGARGGRAEGGRAGRRAAEGARAGARARGRGRGARAGGAGGGGRREERRRLEQRRGADGAADAAQGWARGGVRMAAAPNILMLVVDSLTAGCLRGSAVYGEVGCQPAALAAESHNSTRAAPTGCVPHPGDAHRPHANPPRLLQHRRACPAARLPDALRAANPNPNPNPPEPEPGRTRTRTRTQPEP